MSEDLQKAARIQLTASVQNLHANKQLGISFSQLGKAVSVMAKAIYDSTQVMSKHLFKLGDMFALMNGRGKEFQIILTEMNDVGLAYVEKRKKRADEFESLLSGKGGGGAKPKAGLDGVGQVFQGLRRVGSAFQGLGFNLKHIGSSIDIFKFNLKTMRFPKEGLKSFARSLGNVGIAVAKSPFKAMAAPFKVMGKIKKGTMTAMKGALSTMGPQMALAAMATEALMAGLNAFLEPLEFVTVYFEAFGSILGQLLMPVVEALLPVFDALIPIFQSVVVALMPVVQAFMDALNIEMILPIIEALLPIILILADAFGSIMTAMAPLIELMSATFLGAIQFLVLALTPLIEMIANLLVGAVDSLMGVLNPLIETISVSLAGSVDGLKAFLVALGLVFADIGNKITGAGTTITTFFTNLSGDFTAGFTSAGTSINTFFTDINTDFTTGLASAGTSISTFFTDLPKKFTTGFDNAMLEVTGFFDGMLTNITDALEVDLSVDWF